MRLFKQFDDNGAMYIEEEEAIEDDALAYDLNEEDDADLVDKDVIEKNFSTFIIQKYSQIGRTMLLRMFIVLTPEIEVITCSSATSMSSLASSIILSISSISGSSSISFSKTESGIFFSLNTSYIIV